LLVVVPPVGDPGGLLPPRIYFAAPNHQNKRYRPDHNLGQKMEVAMSIYNRTHFTMKRVIPAAALILLLGTAAYASNVHLKPPHSNPTFNDLILQLRANGGLTGLGFGDVLVNLSATANATATCTNPAGQTQPPGQNPAPVTVAGSEAIPASEVKNGNVSFMVTTNPPTTPIAGAPECPNPQWTEDITDLSFTSATITVQQGMPLATVLTVSCTFSPPTSDGAVPNGTVSCTSQ
jgi:hypothetical protein